MELPINPSPMIKTYSHHAYVGSILDMKVLLDFSIEDCGSKQWERHTGGLLEISGGGRTTIMKGEINNKNTDFRMEREARENDSFVTHIFQITNLQRDAKLVFFVSDRENARVYDDLIFSLTVHKYAYTSDEYGKNRKHAEVHFRDYPFVKVSKRGRKVTFSYSEEGNNWIEQDCVKLPEEGGRYYFGVFAQNVDNSEYFEWVMQNYVNLSFDESAEMTQVYLDYALSPSKNMQYENWWASQFLEISYLPANFLTLEELIPWLKKMLKKGFYVAIALDEFYIPGRRDYQKKNYFHHNLFWGYREEQEEFCIIGYNHVYEPGFLKEEAILASGISKDANIVLYRENRNRLQFNFCATEFSKSLKSFLDGTSPYEDMSGLFQTEKLAFGMNVFGALQNTERGQWVSCFDNRAAYLLLEHASLWCVRVKFLGDKEYIKDKERVFSDAGNLLHLCKNFLFFVQKNMVNAYAYNVDGESELWEQFENRNLREKAEGYLKKIADKERELVENVLKELTNEGG